MRALIAIIAFTGLVACSSESGTGVQSHAGTYTLRTVNGVALPYTIIQIDSTTRLELIDDALTLTDAGTFTESGHGRSTIDGKVTTQANVATGTFTLDGTAITLRNNDPTSMATGTLSGTRLTLIQPGLTAVYEK